MLLYWVRSTGLEDLTFDSNHVLSKSAESQIIDRAVMVQLTGPVCNLIHEAVAPLDIDTSFYCIIFDSSISFSFVKTSAVNRMINNGMERFVSGQT